MAGAKRRDELQPEYDLSKLGPATRGKHLEAFRESSHVAILDPDVASAFPTSEAVNEALRLVVRAVKKELHGKKTRP